MNLTPHLGPNRVLAPKKAARSIPCMSPAPRETAVATERFEAYHVEPVPRPLTGCVRGCPRLRGACSMPIPPQKTGQRCYTMELDPLYCDVIVQRYEQFTGKNADLGQ